MAITYPNHGMKPLPPEAKKVFQGHIFAVWQWRQKLYDGSQAVFERISRADYAYMIGVTREKKIMLAEDEQPDRGVVLTPSGGVLEEGEEPKEAAVRECEEETGYRPARVTYWHSYRPAAKMECEVHAFIGHDIEKVTEPRLEAGERIKPVFYSFEEFLQLGKDPQLRDWLLRVLLLEALLDVDKKEDLRKLLFN